MSKAKYFKFKKSFRLFKCQRILSLELCFGTASFGMAYKSALKIFFMKTTFLHLF